MARITQPLDGLAMQDNRVSLWDTLYRTPAPGYAGAGHARYGGLFHVVGVRILP